MRVFVHCIFFHGRGLFCTLFHTQSNRLVIFFLTEHRMKECGYKNPTMSSAYRVLQNKDLLQYIVSFQNGKKWQDILYADWVCKHGYLSLLQTKKTLYYRDHDMNVAIVNGYFEIAKWLYENHPESCSEDGFMEAVRKDCIDFVQWFYNKGFIQNENMFQRTLWMATKSNSCRVTNFLLSQLTRKEISYRVSIASEDVLNLLQHYGIHVSTTDMMPAFTSGDLNLIKFMLQFTTLTPSHLYEAASKGHLKVFEYFKDLDYSKYDVVHYAIVGNHFHLVQWLSGNTNAYFREFCIDQACFVNNSEMAHWLHEKKHSNCSNLAIEHAIQNNNVELAMWLNNTFHVILETFQPFSTAQNPLQCLQYLHSKGWLYTTECILFCIAVNKYMDTIEWLLTLNINLHSLYCGFASIGDLFMMEWLHKKSVRVLNIDPMCMAASLGYLNILQWLNGIYRENWSTGVMDLAALNGHLPVVEWLDENRREGYTKKGIKGAFKNGHLHIVKWFWVKGFKLGIKLVKSLVRYEQFHILEWLYEECITIYDQEISIYTLLHYAQKKNKKCAVLWLRMKLNNKQIEK